MNPEVHNHTSKLNLNSISLYCDHLNYHFFITEIEEMAKRVDRVNVFLRDGMSEDPVVDELKMLPNVVFFGLNRNGPRQLRRPMKFIKYASSLIDWRRVFDVKYMKAAWVHIVLGWRTACQIEDSGLTSDVHLSFWGHSPEYLVALKCLNPGIVIGTRLHSFD